MEHNPDPAQPDTDATQADDLHKLEQASGSGASWFYWIAGLSLINSAIILFGGEWSFIVGLGVTQIIDVISTGVAQELGSSAATFAKVVAFGGDAMVAGLFVLLGVFAHRHRAWAFVVGMVLYAFDGMIFLLVADWLSVGFHGFALFCIWSGFSASRKLAAQPMVATPAGPEPITP